MLESFHEPSACASLEACDGIRHPREFATGFSFSRPGAECPISSDPDFVPKASQNLEDLVIARERRPRD
jgi:hypothetical protein